jgi:hypothetical protein
MSYKKTPLMWSLPTPVNRAAAMGLGADETDTVVIRRVDANVAQLVAANKAEERRRKLTVIMTGIGVLFAAVKLGFVAVPFLKRRR